ncbi:hypothetical protein MMC10_006507 [Thelotrema lepadinum]|nr:hypothetical protein [Thelotrema lepadinum]
MFITPPSPSSLVTPPPGQSGSRTTSKRHRSFGLLRNSINNLHIPVPTPPTTPAALTEDFTWNDLAADATTPPSSAPLAGLTPPSINPPRPEENQSVGYFPDLDSTLAPALNRARNTLLPCIEEGVVSPQERARSPGATSIISVNSTSSDNGRFSRSMARRRAGSFTSNILGQNARRNQRDSSSNSRSADLDSPPSTNSDSPDVVISTMPANTVNASATEDGSANLAGLPADQMPTIRFIPYQDPRSTKPSLAFTATSRTLPHEGCVIRVGRYSERDTSPGPGPNVPSAAPVGFKSKVVSRRHCEFWCSQGQWYVKDVKSSSGTFLNHIRLSQPSTESRPFPINDSDIIQLGMDFRGGEESIFRCVKIRIECNRAWQKSLNNFNMSTHKQLRALQNQSDAASTNSTECSICLMSVAPCQSLFVAPCSHVWHFKCIRPILNNEKLYPQFLCPNCRAVTDLEADIEDIQEAWETGEDESPDVEEASAQDFASATARRNAANTAAADGSFDEPEDALVDIAAQHSMPEQSDPIPLSATGVATRAAARRGNHLTGGDNTTDSTGDSLSAAQTPSNGLRDPRTASDTLEGVVTPRNEAGPFVFDGTGGETEGGSGGGTGGGSSRRFFPRIRQTIPIEGAIDAGIL